LRRGSTRRLLRWLFSVFDRRLVALRMLIRRRGHGDAAERAVERTRALPLVGMAGRQQHGLLGIGGGLVATPFADGLAGAAADGGAKSVSGAGGAEFGGGAGNLRRGAAGGLVARLAAGGWRACSPFRPASRWPTNCRKRRMRAAFRLDAGGDGAVAVHRTAGDALALSPWFKATCGITPAGRKTVIPACAGMTDQNSFQKCGLSSAPPKACGGTRGSGRRIDRYRRGLQIA
jgi:hypothetical protein